MAHNNTSLEELQRNLITANHILHYNKVVDAYGHISFRHPKDPSIFIMSGSVAPAVVSSPADLIEYHVEDCEPIDPKAKKGYQERFIHGEIFKKFKEVNSVVHGHAEDVLPYTMNGVPLRAVFHVPGFLGTSVPNYDISKLYKPGEKQNLLVNQEHLGANLADHFTSSPTATSKHAVVLMKNHGFTAIGTTIQQVVYRAVYTTANARVQTNAIMLRGAFFGNDYSGLGSEYLDEEQVEACSEMQEMSQDRPWGLWVREVEACPVYKNETPTRMKRRVSRPDW